MKKLESIIFYLFIFSIPIQSRLILHGWTHPFNQWTSTYLYGTDVILAAIFIFWLIRSLEATKISNLKFLIFKQIPTPRSKILGSASFWLSTFFIISAISIFNAQIVGLSLYQLLKLAEFIGVYFYLVRSQTPLVSADAPVAHRTSNGVYLKSSFGRIFNFQSVLAVIIVSGLFQAVVGIVQYIKQGSLGLRLLGESPLSVNATGVAVFFADGIKYLRAYGTTPHPNILAAWLFVAVFAFYFWYLYLKDRRSDSIRYEIMPLLIYTILLFGLFFTFSRVIIGLWAVGVLIGVLIFILRKDFNNASGKIKSRIFKLAIGSLVVVGIFSLLFWPQIKSRIHVSSQEEAVTQRVYYNKVAGEFIGEHLMLGMGVGQFIPNMIMKFSYLPSQAYQPVHNIYLLVVGETGFLGLVAFIGFVVIIFWGFVGRTRFAKLYHYSFFILASSFLVVGFFDHFLWTSQQGGFIFWIILGFLTNGIEVERL
ncbi:MAG: O-antigen ligase family protein [Patescibacteria group bacterium]